MVAARLFTKALPPHLHIDNYYIGIGRQGSGKGGSMGQGGIGVGFFGPASFAFGASDLLASAHAALSQRSAVPAIKNDNFMICILLFSHQNLFTDTEEIITENYLVSFRIYLISFRSTVRSAMTNIDKCRCGIDRRPPQTVANGVSCTT